MVRVRYKVIQSFDPDRNYGKNITRQVSQCLKSLKLDREFEPKEITLECKSDVTLMKNPNFLRAKCIVSDAMTLAKEIGVIDEIKIRPMSFSDFLKLVTVQYFKDQLVDLGKITWNLQIRGFWEALKSYT